MTENWFIAHNITHTVLNVHECLAVCQQAKVTARATCFKAQ